MLDLGRLVTAMITPFYDNGDVNYDEAVRIANYLLETGSQTILLAGTTGESPTLSHDEEFQLFKHVKAGVGSKGLIMAGTGSNCTKTALQSTLKACEAGVDAVLQVVPYYNKPSQEGIYQHFSTVAKNSFIPIMLYNIPGRTGTNMLPETVKRLSVFPNIQTIKEAAGSVEQLKALKALLPADFKLYSGDDALTLDFLKEGAYGVVSVASHVCGREIQAMIQAFNANNLGQAELINNELKNIFEVLFITSNPVPVKAAMKALGFSVGRPRLPLVDVTDQERHRIHAVLEQLKKVQIL
jgi:4-hydroxy-tetrahydrodipicolinate synthase